MTRAKPEWVVGGRGRDKGKPSKSMIRVNKTHVEALRKAN